MRDALKHEPIMGNPDFSKPMEVHCDASYKGLGATLVNKINGVERVISYASRTLTPAEKNYGVWELEALCCGLCDYGVYFFLVELLMLSLTRRQRMWYWIRITRKTEVVYCAGP